MQGMSNGYLRRRKIGLLNRAFCSRERWGRDHAGWNCSPVWHVDAGRYVVLRVVLKGTGALPFLNKNKDRRPRPIRNGRFIDRARRFFLWFGSMGVLQLGIATAYEIPSHSSADDIR